MASWEMETVPSVLEIVSSRLPQRDVCSLLLVSPYCNHALISNPILWQVLDLHEMSKAGERLLSALSLVRYQHVKQINLEFARDIEDEHLILLKSKLKKPLDDLESLNLNGCQKISDKGIEAIATCCPNLKTFSIYWNVRVTDFGIKHLVKNCRHIIDLNLSGCKAGAHFDVAKKMNQSLGYMQLSETCLNAIFYFTNFLDIPNAHHVFCSPSFNLATELADNKLNQLNIASSVVIKKVQPAAKLVLLFIHMNLVMYFEASDSFQRLSMIEYLWPKFTDDCRQLSRFNGAESNKLSSHMWSICCSSKLEHELFRGLAMSCQHAIPLQPLGCVKLTDAGLQQILHKCSSLQSLNLYALSSLTDRTYENMASLADLRFLDLCGAQNLSDRGLSCIARCKNLVSLNLTWCVRITDVGVISLAQGCRSLEFLSLFGIVGVTDASLVALSQLCWNTLTTLDVNGCVGIKRRSRDDLLQLFPHLKCFKVHS